MNQQHAERGGSHGIYETGIWDSYILEPHEGAYTYRQGQQLVGIRYEEIGIEIIEESGFPEIEYACHTRHSCAQAYQRGDAPLTVGQRDVFPVQAHIRRYDVKSHEPCHVVECHGDTKSGQQRVYGGEQANEHKVHTLLEMTYEYIKEGDEKIEDDEAACEAVPYSVHRYQRLCE